MSVVEPKTVPQAPPATMKPKTKTKMTGLIPSTQVPKKIKTYGSSGKIGTRQKSKLKLKEIETEQIYDAGNVESGHSSVTFLSALKSKGSMGKSELKKLISHSVEKNLNEKRNSAKSPVNNIAREKFQP